MTPEIGLLRRPSWALAPAKAAHRLSSSERTMLRERARRYVRTATGVHDLRMAAHLRGVRIHAGNAIAMLINPNTGGSAKLIAPVKNAVSHLGLQRSPCRRRFRGCFEQRVSSSSPDEGYGGDSPQNIVNRLTAGGGTASRSSKVAAPAQVTGRTSPMRSLGCVDTQIRKSSATRTSSASARSRPVGG